jgi:hypothetical protein
LEPNEGCKLVQLEASASSGSLSDFERDFVVISSVPDEPPGESSSSFSDGAHANAAIANATIGNKTAGTPEKKRPAASDARVADGVLSSRPPTAPPSAAAVAAAEASAAAKQSPIGASHNVSPVVGSGQSCLQLSARLVIDLAASRASAGACGSALVLCDLALQALVAAAIQAGAASSKKVAVDLTAAMASAIQIADMAADALQRSGGQQLVLVSPLLLSFGVSNLLNPC